MSKETRNNAADIDSGKKWLALTNGGGEKLIKKTF